MEAWKVAHRAVQLAATGADGHLKRVQRQVDAQRPRGLPACDERLKASMMKAT
jgi:hypothetical protein